MPTTAAFADNVGRRELTALLQLPLRETPHGDENGKQSFRKVRAQAELGYEGQK